MGIVSDSHLSFVPFELSLMFGYHVLANVQLVQLFEITQLKCYVATAKI